MAARKKINVAVIYGGRSGEHEVSVLSAASVISALNNKKYSVRPIMIGKDGRWHTIGQLKPDSGLAALADPDKSVLGPAKNACLAVGTVSGPSDEGVDVVFPLVHGTGGEDGSLQGFLELAGKPYVGSGVLGSALGMDKAVQKKLLKGAGLPVVPWIDLKAQDWEARRPEIVRAAEKTLRYPMFVKPANLGSSVGISKAHDREELVKGVALALRYDTKVLIEKGIVNAREIECAVIGDDAEVRVSVPGEIVPSNEFYDYEAKYIDGRSEMRIPAELPAALAKRVRCCAERVFRTLETHGYARVDCFVTRGPRPKVYINEINTIPGFTRFSMFPKLWEASGLPYDQLLDVLIGYALARGERQSRLERSYEPKRKGGEGR